MSSFFTVIFAGFALYVLWTVVRPRWHFKIVVKNDIVEIDRGIPEGKRRTVESFFVDDLKSSQNLRIYGRRESTGRLTTLIKGIDDEGLKQRVRNFLISVL